MKKSFKIYIDSLDVFDELSDEEIGRLFKAIRAFHREEVFNIDRPVAIAFTQFKKQFERDNEAYKKICETNKLIATKRHEASRSNKLSTKRNEASRSNKLSTKRNEASRPSTLSTDKDKDTDKDTKEEEERSWNFINKIKLKYGGVKFTIDKTDYFFRDDGKLATWNTNRAVTAPKAMMLYQRMNENSNAVLYHLKHNKTKV